MQEDLSAFLNDFGISATWAPSNGGAQVSTKVLFDAVETPTDYGDLSAWQKQIEITLPANEFSGLKRDEKLSINGVYYRVRDVALIDDGKMKSVTLGEFNQ